MTDAYRAEPSSSTTGDVLFERPVDGVALITINRPDKRNALSQGVIREIGHFVAECRDDPGVRVICLTGAGDKAFAAGADIAELNDADQWDELRVTRVGQEVCRTIESSETPVIALINGIAFGGGFELALACPLRIGSENCSLGLPEVKLGLIPGWGGTQRLTRELGRAKALRFILTGEAIDSETALSLGLLADRVPQAELLDTGLRLASEIAKQAPLAVAAALSATYSAIDLGAAGFTVEALLVSLLFTSEDSSEGLSAFLQKRPPTFHGR